MDQKYSKRTWIITCVLAVMSIIMDVLFLAGVFGQESGFIRDSAYMTMAIAGFILYKAIRGIVSCCKEEKEAPAEKNK